jgi:hypothetical protein
MLEFKIKILLCNTFVLYLTYGFSNPSVSQPRLSLTASTGRARGFRLVAKISGDRNLYKLHQTRLQLITYGWHCASP